MRPALLSERGQECRQENGLSTLLISDLRTDAARKHSSDMAKYDFFGHITLQSDWFAVGATYLDRLAVCGYDYNAWKGENVGAQFATAQAGFALWKDSAIHNTVMLDANFRVIGVGLVEGGSYGHYWTVEFGGYIDPTAHEPSPVSTPSSFLDVPTAHTYYQGLASPVREDDRRRPRHRRERGCYLPIHRSRRRRSGQPLPS